MNQVPFSHVPVMLDEVLELFAAVPAGWIIDATLGGAGHARALLEARPDLRLLGIDRDADAIAAATEALAAHGERARLVHARFDSLRHLAEGLDGDVVGVLFDLGVSSPQLDRGERGFSYRTDAPLDMRMDRTSPVTAADVVNGWEEGDLARLLREHGEGRFARRIAARIVAARPLTTTAELAEVVRAAIPAAARRTGGHPAKRAFQAIRVAVNAELDILPDAIDDAIGVLAPGGRIGVLSYHSGEDRIVKDRFRAAETGGCTCPPQLPCGCGAVATATPVFRGSRQPSQAEQTRNPRAESARFRAAQKLPPTAPASDSPRRGER